MFKCECINGLQKLQLQTFYSGGWARFPPKYQLPALCCLNYCTTITKPARESEGETAGTDVLPLKLSL